MISPFVSTARPKTAFFVSWLLALFLIQETQVQPARAQQAPDQDIPEVVRDLLERAQHQQATGRLDQALQAYQDALELEPRIALAHLGLGVVFVHQGANAKALEAFATGLEIDPDHRDLLFNAAVIALRLERFDEAIRWAEHATGTHDRDVELRLVQAAILDRLDRDEEALEALRVADRLAPDQAQILFRLGNQLHKLSRNEEAVDAYRLALEEDKSLLRAHYNLGAVLLALDRFDEALDAYRVALAPFDRDFRKGELPDTEHAPAYANLGAIYSQRREWDEALDAYDKSLRLEPGHSERLYNRGFVHYQMGDFKAATRNYEAALADRPDLPLAHLHLGFIARQKGECAGATQRLEAGMEFFSTAERLAALEIMAFCYAELRQPEKAEAAFRDVLAPSPGDPELLLGLGKLLRRQGRLEEALDLLEKAAEARPDHLPTGLERLAVAEVRGDLAAQKELAEHLLARHPEHAELWRVRWSLALLMLQQGQLTSAAGHLAALAEQAPEEEKPRIIALEAMSAAALGDLRTAREKLRTVAYPSKGDQSAAAAAVLDVLDGGGEKAVLALEKATPTDGPWTSHNTDLGLLYWSLGRGDAARRLLVAAEAAGDRGPAVLAALGDTSPNPETALEYLDRARELCADPPPPRADAGVLRVRLSALEPGLCPWIENAARRARLQREIDRLGSGAGEIAVADEVLASTAAADDERAMAHYLRGVLRVRRGLDGSADLRQALRGGLAAQLTGATRLYLGVALGRRGALDEARRELDAARAVGGEIGAAATLNLAILVDGDDGRRALELYEAYLQAGGPRAREVRGWVERLRRVYQ